MSHRDELVRAARLLAVAMSAGSVLSACQQQTPAAPPSPNVTPATTPGGSAAQPGAPTAASSVDELRRAAGVLRDFQRRDPTATAQVLAEMGLFACDETTTACIAAKNAHQSSVASAPAPPPQPTQPSQPQVPPRPEGAVA